MKVIESLERTTGMGAVHYTAVLLDGKWVRISEHPEAKYLGRQNGFSRFLLYVSDDAVTAKFYRSNRGNEHVVTSNGKEWNSFWEAEEWASSEDIPKTCPTCGRRM